MRVLFAGGTGFVGKTVLDDLVPLRGGAPLELTLLSRDPNAFLAANRTLVQRAGVQVTVLRQVLPELTLSGRYDVVIHGAEIPAAMVAADHLEHSAEVLRALLAFAERAGARRFVYLSSGAVYALDERLEAPFAVQSGFEGTNLDAGAYAYSKYLSECEVRRFSQAADMDNVIVRIFNVASAHLPLAGRYALGNFVRDFLDPACPAIQINGSGRDLRSFIAGPQLAGLVAHCLDGAPDGAIYNACSNHALSILDLAELVREESGIDKPITVAAPDAPARDYTGIANLAPTLLSSQGDIRHAVARLVAAHAEGLHDG